MSNANLFHSIPLEKGADIWGDRLLISEDENKRKIYIFDGYSLEDWCKQSESGLEKILEFYDSFLIRIWIPHMRAVLNSASWTLDSTDEEIASLCHEKIVHAIRMFDENHETYVRNDSGGVLLDEEGLATVKTNDNGEIVKTTLNNYIFTSLERLIDGLYTHATRHKRIPHIKCEICGEMVPEININHLQEEHILSGHETMTIEQYQSFGWTALKSKNVLIGNVASDDEESKATIENIKAVDSGNIYESIEDIEFINKIVRDNIDKQIILARYHGSTTIHEIVEHLNKNGIFLQETEIYKRLRTIHRRLDMSNLKSGSSRLFCHLEKVINGNKNIKQDIVIKFRPSIHTFSDEEINKNYTMISRLECKMASLHTFGFGDYSTLTVGIDDNWGEYKIRKDRLPKIKYSYSDKQEKSVQCAIGHGIIMFMKGLSINAVFGEDVLDIGVFCVPKDFVWHDYLISSFGSLLGKENVDSLFISVNNIENKEKDKPIKVDIIPNDGEVLVQSWDDSIVVTCI